MRTMRLVAVLTVPVFAMGVAAFPAGAASTGSQDAMSVSDLPDSVVPANCEMPRQRLHHNTTARKYLPKQGWINLSRPGRPIYAHLRPGRSEVVATYNCTAGGVGWPQVIVAYSPGGRLIDGLDLYHFSHQEYAMVTGWRAVGHSVRMHWISEDGCCSNKHRHHSRIMLSQGRLVLNPIR
ncbi:MAG: hypothetical protein QOK30_3173 [Nocardioidaceae bacterium]|nr:hypothetical protein [Nocardioidaceae bacterium]